MKTDEQEVINFLLTTEIIPLCLRIMESGSELSKTVCVFILIRFYIVDSWATSSWLSFSASLQVF